jgi:hypothetical protein
VYDTGDPLLVAHFKRILGRYMTPAIIVGDTLHQDPLSVYDTDDPLLVTHSTRILGPLQKDPLSERDTPRSFGGVTHQKDRRGTPTEDR